MDKTTVHTAHTDATHIAHTNTTHNAHTDTPNAVATTTAKQDVTTTKTTKEPRHKPQSKKIPGKDLGVLIVTYKSQGWPKESFDEIQLKQDLENNKYKWSYTNTRYEEEEVYNAIINNEIDLHGCWHQVDDVIYKKLRSGIQKQAKPPAPKH